MAAPMVRCCLRTVSIQCPSPIFTRIGQHSAVVPAFANLLISHRLYSAKKQTGKTRFVSGAKKKTTEPEAVQKKKRYKPVLPSGPTDDVYLTWCYERPIYEAEVAVDMLKKFQELDFTHSGQYVYADLTLDMSMGKKKPVEPFAATLLLPYQSVDDFHKVVVFTENADEAAIAKENGAAFVGGFELVKPISDGAIQADFYVAVPAITSKLNSLRAILKDKHPKSKNGSVSYDIPKMLSFFKVCHEYKVENENSIKTVIATIKKRQFYFHDRMRVIMHKITVEAFFSVRKKGMPLLRWHQPPPFLSTCSAMQLDMPRDQIVANLDAVIKDVCKYKPLSYGPFVKRLIIRSSTSEGLDLKFERFLPKAALKGKVEEKAKEEDDDSGDEGAMRESN